METKTLIDNAISELRTLRYIVMYGDYDFGTLNRGLPPTTEYEKELQKKLFEEMIEQLDYTLELLN